MPPIIGITATLKEDVEAVAERPLGRFVRADLDYIEGVAGAGGAPVVLPPTGDEGAAEAVIQSLDGLLLSGGSDLDPGYYGEEPVPELGVTLPERDAFEMALVRLALRRGMPVFGICRGMQVLNVALGGTLYQDLPSQWEGDVLKHRQDTPKWQPAHEVRVEETGPTLPRSWTARLVKVNSYHHQGVKDPRRRAGRDGPLHGWGDRGRRGRGPLRAVAARRPVARRGYARRRSSAGEPLRGARLGGGASRPAQGCGLAGRPAAQSTRRGIFVTIEARISRASPPWCGPSDHSRRFDDLPHTSPASPAVPRWPRSSGRSSSILGYRWTPGRRRTCMRRPALTTCAHGYSRVSKPARTCSASGTWTPASPTRASGEGSASRRYAP